jgi:hypothetical protein
VDQVAAALQREVEVVVAEPAVAIVFLATVLLRDDVRDLLREAEGLAAGEDGGVLREVHVRVVPRVVRVAVQALAGRGHGDTHLTVRAEARVQVVHVPELDNVVLELKALGEDPPQRSLVHPVEERRPPGVGVGQRHDVVVDQRVRNALGNDVALVAVQGQRRRVAGVDPGNAGDVQLCH